MGGGGGGGAPPPRGGGLHHTDVVEGGLDAAPTALAPTTTPAPNHQAGAAAWLMCALAMELGLGHSAVARGALTRVWQAAVASCTVLGVALFAGPLAPAALPGALLPRTVAMSSVARGGGGGFGGLQAKQF